MQFYELEQCPQGDADTCYSEEEGYNQGDAASCPACGGATSLLSWLPPYRVVIELHGKEFGDFVFIPAGNDFLVSQKFREVYYSNGLTGLSGFDAVEVLRVKTRRKRLPNPPAYFRVTASYGQTALDLKASGLEWHEPPKCDYCRSAMKIRWQCLIVEDGTWSGEDAFRPRGLSSRIIVTQRFKDACEQNGITNAVFTPAELAGHDFEPWNKG